MSPIVRSLLLEPPPITDLRLLPGLELWLSTKDPADIIAGTGAGALGWRDRSGKSNETVLGCDGTAGAAFTNGQAFGTGDFSICMWVSPSLSAAQVLVGATTDTCYAQLRTDGTFDWYSNAVRTFSAAGAVAANQRQYLSITRTGGAVALGVNGAAIAVTAPADTQNITTALAKIGSLVSNLVPVGGYIQRPAIWLRALSAGEIAALYAAGGVATAVSSANLMAYWDFSTATRGAATVTDTSGNSCVLTTSTGARVSGSRDAWQGTASAQPAWDLATRTLTGDGVDNSMRTPPFPLVQPWTTFDVFNMVTWTDTDVICDGFTAATGQIEQVTTTPQININAGSSVAANTVLAVAVDGVVVATFNGASSTLQVNRTSPTTGNAGAGTANGITLFSAGGTAAKWANVAYKEKAIISRVLSASEKLRIINFLIRRCAVTP